MLLLRILKWREQRVESWLSSSLRTFQSFPVYRQDPRQWMACTRRRDKESQSPHYGLFARLPGLERNTAKGGVAQTEREHLNNGQAHHQKKPWCYLPSHSDPATAPSSEVCRERLGQTAMVDRDSTGLSTVSRRGWYRVSGATGCRGKTSAYLWNSMKPLKRHKIEKNKITLELAFLPLLLSSSLFRVSLVGCWKRVFFSVSMERPCGQLVLLLQPSTFVPLFPTEL